MTYLLSTATLELARKLQHVREGTATGGSATTLIDTGRAEADDDWNGGTLWVKVGTNNTGKSREITDWTNSTGTFLFATMTTVCAAGDTYAASDKKFPRDLLIRAVNNALRSIGNVQAENTTLTTVADQETYTLPAGVYNVKQIHIADSLTAPYEWVPQLGIWEEIPASGIIRFDTNRQPGNTGYTIRLIYQVPPTEISSDSSTISDYIDLELLTIVGKYEAIAIKISSMDQVDKFWENELAKAYAAMLTAKRQFPVKQYQDHSRRKMCL